MASKTCVPKESRKLVNRKASAFPYNCGISFHGTWPRNSTLLVRWRRCAHCSHCVLISPSPAISSFAFKSWFCPRASSANGSAFLGSIRPTQSSVKGLSLGAGTSGFKIKRDGIPESRKSLTFRPPALASKRPVSWFVARMSALDLAALRREKERGSVATRMLRRISRLDKESI